MNRELIEILMKRDGISEEHARSLIEETRDEIMSLDDPCEADEVIMNMLGLEPDYLEDVLGI